MRLAFPRLAVLACAFWASAAVALPSGFVLEDAAPGAGFEVPTSIAFFPDGRFLVGEKSGLVWDEKTLNLFLAKPLAVVPGSTMTYDGVSEARDRGDLIAYLKTANSAAPCRK